MASYRRCRDSDAAVTVLDCSPVSVPEPGVIKRRADQRHRGAASSLKPMRKTDGRSSATLADGQVPFVDDRSFAPERAPAERAGKGHDLRIQDNVQRVVGGLATLARAGDIDPAQSSAAERWYRDYVMGVIGARDPEARRSGKAPDIHASMFARTSAVARCRSVREGLGLCGEIRLKLLLVDELSFSAIASKLLPGDVNGRKKVAAQMSFLLEQLTELYGFLDRRRADPSGRQSPGVSGDI